MKKFFLISGSLFAMLSVILGAFGAHGLKKHLDEAGISVFETGVKYQMYHSLALILLAITFGNILSKNTLLSGYFFIAGIVLFSGSLYVITLLKLNNSSIPTGLGILTPLGGLCFIIGWVFYMLSIIKYKF